MDLDGFGWILYGFWIDFGWIWVDFDRFGWILYGFGWIWIHFGWILDGYGWTWFAVL